IPTRAALMERLLDAVTTSTGYPRDMLSVDFDIEAELGIDSIKRLEILQAFQGVLPAQLVAELTREMDTISRAKTLEGMVGKIEEIAVRLRESTPTTSPDPAPTIKTNGSRPAPTLAPSPAKASDDISPDRFPCPRYLMRCVPE